jgi:putative hemolysin
MVDSIHSRLPVHEGSPDEPIGVLQSKDLLDAYLMGDDPDVRAFVRPVQAVPEMMDALDAVGIIKDSAVHMVFVTDEYGHFQGVVTNADILEAIIGVSRTDEGLAEPDAVRRGDGSWLLSGGMPADEMAERLGVALPKARAYHTAAGFVLDRIGHLPAVGEAFHDQGWEFEIVDLDGRRIDKILAKRGPRLPRRARG